MPESLPEDAVAPPQPVGKPRVLATRRFVAAAAVAAAVLPLLVGKVI